MALRFPKALLIAGALAGLASLALVACGGDDDTPDPTGTPASPTQPSTPTPGGEGGTPTKPPTTPTTNPGTTTPTPEANNIPGLVAALQQLNKELAAGKVDPLIARFKVIDYTCTAADVAGGLGAAQGCTSVGQTFKAFQTSNWRSEGGIRKIEDVVANLQGYGAGFDTSKSDAFGPGTFRVYAYDPSTKTAVLTVTSKCLPQHQCASGFQRLVFVAELDYLDSRWKIESLMYAFVLGEEFLDPPSAEVKQRMPQWTKFQ